MKSVAVSLETQGDIEILPIADVHYGDEHCNIKELQKQLDYVKSHENAYVIFNGDLLNWASKYSVSDIYSENKQPMEQINWLIHFLSPIKDKILAITSGNHENRAYKTEGIDTVYLASQNIGILDRYSQESIVLFLRFGELNHQHTGKKKNEKRKICYTIFINHGSGGGRKEGAKINRLVEMSNIVDTDIYIHSHTHLPAIVKKGFFRIDTRNNATAKVDKLYVNTNSFLEYGGYADSHEYTPSSIETPIIKLGGKIKKYTATL